MGDFGLRTLLAAIRCSGLNTTLKVSVFGLAAVGSAARDVAETDTAPASPSTRATTAPADRRLPAAGPPPADAAASVRAVRDCAQWLSSMQATSYCDTLAVLLEWARDAVPGLPA
jgi:hypothetical protein